MADLKPLPSNPTNADLAQSIAQLHACLEDSVKETQNGLLSAANERNKIRRDHLSLVKTVNNVDSKVINVTKIVESISSKQDQVKDVLGVEKAKKPIGLISQTRFAVTIFGAASAAGGLWRFTEYMFPTFMGMFHQIHLYIIR